MIDLRRRRAPSGPVWLPGAVLAGLLVGVPLLSGGEEARERTLEQDARDEVKVERVAHDHAIRARLQRILEATGWFTAPQVRVQQGVVFLSGRVRQEEHRRWAGDLARRTEDVVAVVNRVEVVPPAIWDWRPAWSGLKGVYLEFLQTLPYLGVGLALLLAGWAAGRATTRAMRWHYRRRGELTVIAEAGGRAIGFLVFVLGLYLALRVMGLTRLAATVLGGTGILGLVLGIAFRDITENLLASILLARQQPFRRGDLVEVQGVQGIVQRLTLRTTVLMTLDGNHLQIPNATVYKSTLRNFTSHSQRRLDFIVGIGYDQAISRAQGIAQAVLEAHPAVLRSPVPWVLVDALGKATVQLRVYFWIDGTQHSWLKVLSSVMRLVKRAFQEQGVSMPDEAREVLFPDGVPVRMIEAPPAGRAARQPAAQPPEAEAVCTASEVSLEPETGQLQALASRTRSPERGRDLLEKDE